MLDVELDDRDRARTRQTQSWSLEFGRWSPDVHGEDATGGRDSGVTKSTENFRTSMGFPKQPSGNGRDVHSPNVLWG